MKKSVLLIAFLAGIIIFKFVLALPLDNTLPGGTDTSSHLFKVWYIVNEGIVEWNKYWYAGSPLFKYYPNISYIIAGTIGKIFNFLFAYKLMNNIFVALTPLIFYFLLKEFKLSKEKIILAVILFSFIPIHAYYLVDGRYTTLANLFFSLLAWIFLKRAIDGGEIKNVLLTAVFLSFSILTHHNTSFVFIPIVFGWGIIHSWNKRTFLKIVTILLLTLLLVSWWAIPFVIETFGSKGTVYTNLVETNPGKMIGGIKNVLFNLNLFRWEFGPQLAIIVGLASGIAGLLSIFKLKDKITRDFILTTIILIIILFIVNYKRVFIFLTIPLSILMTQGISTLRKNLSKLLLALILGLIVLSYVSIKPQMYPYPEYPNIQNDGRVMFLPLGDGFEENEKENKYLYSVMLSPMNENENIYGWFIESQRIGESANKKLEYYNLINQPEIQDQEKYYNLLKDGWVNYVVINKKYDELINYFESSSRFSKIETIEKFFVFQINPKSSYVDINGVSSENDFKKLDNKITVKMVCKPGTITIKESYHKYWNGLINNKSISLEPSEYGFINIDNEENGLCNIELLFINPNYYLIFNFTSIFSWACILLYLIKKSFSHESRK